MAMMIKNSISGLNSYHTARFYCLVLAGVLAMSLFPQHLIALRLDIRLYSKATLNSLTFTVVQGEYKIQGGSNAIDLQRFQVVKMKASEGKVQLIRNDKVILQASSVQISGQAQDNIFRLHAHKHRERNYDDDLQVKARGNTLILINQVDLEYYIAGVVESESGRDGSTEFYKVQDIISRTYALKNLRRHKHEGFNLCDEEHCQVYHSRSYLPIIQDAATQTAGLVLVDSAGELITAAYHANSGGETANSEDVWTLPLPYLRAQVDTFGEQMSRARWEKRIYRKDWVKYFQTKHGMPLTEENIEAVTRFNQTTRQTSILGYISLKEVRADWRLRSTFFSVEPQGDVVILSGRGWGHGVGLNQQGAIRMTELGWSHLDVLRFYYPGVRIVNLSELTQPLQP